MQLRMKVFFMVFATTYLMSCQSKKETNQNETKANNPNIIIILADDLGYGDITSYNPNSKVPTPNIDKLAAQGVSFTDAHTPSAVCTPTRYGVLTGRYAWRTRLKSGVLNGYAPMLIKKDQPTIASVLKNDGYHTANIGKWHLGLDWTWNLDSIPMKESNLMYLPEPGQVNYEKPIVYGPNDVGFDFSYIVPASLDMSPYVYVQNNMVVSTPSEVFNAKDFPVYLRPGEISRGFSHVDVADHILYKARDYISERANKDQPFFLYFPLTSPHKPVIPHHRFKGKSGIGLYGDFLVQTDWMVGEIMKTLEKENIVDNTLIILTSDNGSFMYRYEDDRPDHFEDPSVQGYSADRHTANGDLRGTKTDIYEGGHRVPFIVSWPDRIEKGQKVKEPICLTDIAATLFDITASESEMSKMEDSYSFASLLLGKAGFKRPPIIHHSVNGTFAMRKGDMKLVLSDGSGGRELPRGKPFSKPYRLFDMEKDPYETEDILEGNQSVIDEMLSQFEEITNLKLEGYAE